VSKKIPPRPSLLKHFEAPDGHTGEFGWICGYSADASFLNEAAFRFTGQSKPQREASGEVRLALMLDPRQPALLPTAVPGLTHLALRSESRNALPFRLLHAKVALLGFRHRTDVSKWHVRLIVSTGNWTRQTAEESLDLACLVDVDSESLGPALAQECMDISAARQWLRWLIDLHDARLLEAPPPMYAGNAASTLAGWISSCSSRKIPKDGYTPRFIHNRSSSLFDSIVNAVAAHDKPKATRLVMGSGFFEAVRPIGGNGAFACASVPLKIVERLKDEQLLSPSARVELHVNPFACQAIAHSIAHLEVHAQHPMTVHAAQVSSALGEGYERRALHAKFMAAARKDRSGSHFSHAWVYLGSGNLTPAGMMLRMSPEGGNAEAGMVLFASEASWGGRSKLALDLQDALPIAGARMDADAPGLSAGEPWQPPAGEHFAPPVAFLQCKGDGSLQLPPQDDDVAVAIELIDEDGNSCTRVAGGFAWTGQMPRMVRIRWSEADLTREAMIPVVDADGRVAAVPLAALSLDHAESQLLAFPDMLDPEGDDDEDGLGDPPPANEKKKGAPRTPATPATGGDDSAIRQMMGLLERIAGRQVKMHSAEWARWCQRLQQTLCQTSQSQVVAQFVALGLDPLSPLYAAPFRPSYAESGDSEQGLRYEAALDAVADAWGTRGLAPLEGLA